METKWSNILATLSVRLRAEARCAVKDTSFVPLLQYNLLRGVRHMMGQIARRAVINSVLAGIIAGIIYVIIAVVTKSGTATSIAVGGVLIGLFTLVVAFIINILISSIFARR